MNTPKVRSYSISILRWIARFWAVLNLMLALAIAVPPDAAPPADSILVGAYWISVVGLLIAWGYELPGSLIAIAGLIIRIILFRMVRGFWELQLPVAVALLTPAFLFLLCWSWSRSPSKGTTAPAQMTLKTGSKE